MSTKVKQLELEESALFIAEKLLVEIETLIDNMDFSKKEDVEKLKTLVDTFQNLKPYF